MSGDVGVTAWGIGVESIVVSGVDEMEGHGEDDETVRMGDSLAYKGCSQRGQSSGAADSVQQDRRNYVQFRDVTSH